MYRLTAFCLFLCMCNCTATAYNYGPSNVISGDRASVGSADGEAAAAAYTNHASSAAVATHITAADYEDLQRNAHQQRGPYLTGNISNLSQLVSALMPTRTQVFKSSPGFVKGHDGSIQFVGGSSLAFVAV